MKTRKYAIITGIIVLLMCLSGCKSNKYDKSGVKVVFELEGGTYQNSTLPVVYYYKCVDGSIALCGDRKDFFLYLHRIPDR